MSFAGVPASWERDLMAVLLWGRSEAAVSHRAAARVWGFDGFSSAPIEVSITRSKTGHALRLASGRDIVIHRCDRRLLSQVTTRNEFAVTSVPRTVIDLAGKKHPRTEGCIDSAIRRDLSSAGQIWRLLEREWMRGRRGVAITRDLLIPRIAGQAPTESDLELDGLRLVDEAGLPSPVVAFPIHLPIYGSARIDLAFPGRRLAIELDSVLWHLDRRAFERDRRKDAELVGLGWRVIRLTWAMLRFERSETRALVRDAFHSCVEAA